MPVQISSFLEGRVIYLRAYGIVTLDDIRRIKPITQSLTRNAPTQNIHFIGDVREVEEIPINLRLISRTNFMVAGLTGWTVVIGDSNKAISHIAQLTATALSQVMKFKLRTFDNMADALIFLMQMDNTLPDLFEMDASLPQITR